MMSHDGSRRRVVYSQLEELWEFLNSHREIACGYNKSIKARDHYRSRWKAMATTLNSHEDGAYKDWKGWCKYWVDYKSKLKKMVTTARAHQQKTGGRPAEKQFTEIECKFMHILGEDFGAGIPGATVEPYEEFQDIQQLCEVSLSGTGSVSLTTPPMPTTPPQDQPSLANESGSSASGDTRTLTSLQVRPFSASLPGPPSPAGEARVPAQSFPRRRRRIGDPPPIGCPPRRRLTRHQIMSVETSRRALIEMSDRRAEADENRNRILDEKLQRICIAVENNNINTNKALQELTQAINNLTQTIIARLPEQR